LLSKFFRRSAADERHHPSRYKNSANEHGKAVEAVSHLLLSGIALGDAKYDGRKQSENYGSREMR
jgi:hypothetical protein